MSRESTEEIDKYLKVFILIFWFEMEWGLEDSVHEKIAKLEMESLCLEGNLQKYLIKAAPEVESIEISDPMINHLIAQLKKGGMEGPLNWYRTRSLDYADEQAADLPVEFPSDIPCLFIGASKDPALPPAMFTQEMKERLFPKHNLTTIIFEDANHFLLNAPAHRDKVTKTIGDWIDEQDLNFSSKSADLLLLSRPKI
ncbi:hypothetical protein O181_001303 [Austropuccinia psidii MF-1]|uniref:Uncharacterized protein n=1 Tax=Austropuccinia psidii MF-1 TaxID=1389203 RepID=A0A9Q3GBL1_9BASI|nr:hypothetical protein [Austropuccinia psidii MF-1]